MTQSEIIIKFCARQSRLLEALELFHQSVEAAYEEMRTLTSPRLEKAVVQLRKWQSRLAKEIKPFNHVIGDSSLVSLSIRPQLERIASQARQLSEGVMIRYRQVSEDEWGQSLSHLSHRVAELKADLKCVDLKEAMGHVTDVVLVDYFEDLGDLHVIQWPRKIWHMFAASLIVSIYLFLPVSFKTKLIIFASFTAFTIPCDILPLTWPKLNALVIRSLKKYMRKREVTGFNTGVFFAVSTLTVCLIFPKGIAILAILFLGFGDPLASIVGIKWGKHPMGRRFSIEGSLAFFGSCFLISLLYPFLAPGFNGPLLFFAFFGGIIGMVSEWCSFRLDDNLVIPLVSATLLQGVVFLMG